MRPKHIEDHFTGGDHLRDIVIGMSDGLTVPFALAAGLSGAVQGTRLVVVAGLAEIAAGSIAMGLGGYLAGRSDAEHFESELQREEREIIELPEEEEREVSKIMQTFGMTAEESASAAAAMRKRPRDWVDFMMRFELGLERPDPRRAMTSAVTIALSYIFGGLIPLAPYMLMATNHGALMVSVAVTLVALAIFGFVKAHFTGTPALRGALQTTAIGGFAAAAAFGLARLVS